MQSSAICANQSYRCPMCNREIPLDFIEQPQLPEVEKSQESDHISEYQWFYERRNSWRKYDPVPNIHLEIISKLGNAQCELLIDGVFYIIDFVNEYQYRKDSPRHICKIKVVRKYKCT